jgi:glucose-6-phosphate isomerase, archaeal
MKHTQIKKSPVNFNLTDYSLVGEPIINQIRKLNDLKGIFHNARAYSTLNMEQIIYTVQSWLPVPEGTPGGLFFGTTNLMHGKVGNEYFMTKGHFHTLSDRAEFYWGVKGVGILILMDRDRNVWTEKVSPGSLHYIPAHVAHRVANTGNSPLIFSACWPSDSGHDYEEIAVKGFSARLIEKNGKPELEELKNL